MNILRWLRKPNLLIVLFYFSSLLIYDNYGAFEAAVKSSLESVRSEERGANKFVWGYRASARFSAREIPNRGLK